MRWSTLSFCVNLRCPCDKTQKTSSAGFPEVNIGIRIPRPASVTKRGLHYPVYILVQNVAGHMALTDMQGDIYITLGEGLWNLTFPLSSSVCHLSTATEQA